MNTFSFFGQNVSLKIDSNDFRVVLDSQYFISNSTVQKQIDELSINYSEITQAISQLEQSS